MEGGLPRGRGLGRRPVRGLLQLAPLPRPRRQRVHRGEIVRAVERRHPPDRVRLRPRPQGVHQRRRLVPQRRELHLLLPPRHGRPDQPGDDAPRQALRRLLPRGRSRSAQLRPPAPDRALAVQRQQGAAGERPLQRRPLQHRARAHHPRTGVEGTSPGVVGGRAAEGTGPPPFRRGGHAGRRPRQPRDRSPDGDRLPLHRGRALPPLDRGVRRRLDRAHPGKRGDRPPTTSATAASSGRPGAGNGGAASTGGPAGSDTR